MSQVFLLIRMINSKGKINAMLLCLLYYFSFLSLSEYKIY